MKAKPAIFFFLSLFLIHIAHGMDTKQITKVKTRLFTNEDDLPGKMVHFLENKENKQIAINSLVMSNPRVIKAINERGDSINGRIGGHYMTDFTKIPKLTKDEDEHGKNFCSEHNCLVSTANASNSIYKHGNKEWMISVKGDTELATNMYKQMTSTSPIKENKSIITITPTKNTSYSSRNTELNKSRVQRVTNLIEKHKKNPDTNNFISAITMNLNDKKTAKAFQKSAESNIKTKLLVNKSALTKDNISLLEKIHNAGGDVRVYDPQELKRSILHTKMLLTPTTLVVSNANFTHEGDQQNNIETYFPNNKKLIKAAKKNFRALSKECTPLPKALELHATKKEQDNKKRQLEAEIKISKTKKQKLIDSF